MGRVELTANCSQISPRDLFFRTDACARMRKKRPTLPETSLISDLKNHDNWPNVLSPALIDFFSDVQQEEPYALLNHYFDYLTSGAQLITEGYWKQAAMILWVATEAMIDQLFWHILSSHRYPLDVQRRLFQTPIEKKIDAITGFVDKKNIPRNGVSKSACMKLKLVRNALTHPIEIIRNRDVSNINFRKESTEEEEINWIKTVLELAFDLHAVIKRLGIDAKPVCHDLNSLRLQKEAHQLLESNDSPSFLFTHAMPSRQGNSVPAYLFAETIEAARRLESEESINLLTCLAVEQLFIDIMHKLITVGKIPEQMLPNRMYFLDYVAVLQSYCDGLLLPKEIELLDDIYSLRNAYTHPQIELFHFSGIVEREGDSASQNQQDSVPGFKTIEVIEKISTLLGRIMARTLRIMQKEQAKSYTQQELNCNFTQSPRLSGATAD